MSGASFDMGNGVVFVDHGIQTDERDGQPRSLYVTEIRLKCQRCGLLHQGWSRVDVDFARLLGDPHEFRVSQDNSTLAALREGPC